MVGCFCFVLAALSGFLKPGPDIAHTFPATDALLIRTATKAYQALSSVCAVSGRVAVQTMFSLIHE